MRRHRSVLAIRALAACAVCSLASAITSSPLPASRMSYPCWRSCSATTTRMPGSSSHTRIRPSPRSAGSAISEVDAGIGRARRPRELHPQRRARAVLVGLRPDRAAMLLDDAAADRQAQPRAALLAGVRRTRPAGSGRTRPPACPRECRGPRSTTFSSTEFGSESIWTETVEPAGENLIAFDSRLVSTCRMRSESASK